LNTHCAATLPQRPITVKHLFLKLPHKKAASLPQNPSTVKHKVKGRPGCHTQNQLSSIMLK
jgi:hypothetical protein